MPGEVSVAGFDDIPVAAGVYPGLTTVRLPLTDMGRQALELVLNPPAARPRRRRTGHELVVRASTGPAPAPSGPTGHARRPVPRMAAGTGFATPARVNFGPEVTSC
ncbi:hypothetical protein FHR32_000170 [Streptosporangium album]|uniref:Transcriptional regulator LacI/GalR-like sensor domain-containing protein n=1 Tax=Streptosporangium album TaxID=47479 RepID=A0A7W7W7F1_9ACTN|nr:substrate-binding domain-containing protein [Streptosporangium album]MBB4935865.1 hypothetical protein [Streptosporangium album]